jgi:hypothetical protein
MITDGSDAVLFFRVLFPPVSKINKAISRGQIAISAPLINPHPSSAYLNTIE